MQASDPAGIRVATYTTSAGIALHLYTLPAGFDLRAAPSGELRMLGFDPAIARAQATRLAASGTGPVTAAAHALALRDSTPAGQCRTTPRRSGEVAPTASRAAASPAACPPSCDLGNYRSANWAGALAKSPAGHSITLSAGDWRQTALKTENCNVPVVGGKVKAQSYLTWVGTGGTVSQRNTQPLFQTGTVSDNLPGHSVGTFYNFVELIGRNNTPDTGELLTPLATFSITTGDAYVADVQWFAPTGSVIPNAAQATLEDATTGQVLTTGKFSAVKIGQQVYPVSDFFGTGLPGPAVDEREAWTKPSDDPQPYTLLADPYLGNDYWGGADYYLDYNTSGSPLGTSQSTIPYYNIQMYDGHQYNSASASYWVYSTKRLSGPVTPIGANGWADKWLGCGQTDAVVPSS